MPLRTNRHKVTFIILTMTCALCLSSSAATSAVHGYVRNALAKAGRTDVKFRKVEELGNDEAFRVIEKGGKLVVEHQTSAGALYGAQAVVQGDYQPGEIEIPDFKIRGTTLCLMGGGYKSKLMPDVYPWFYDKEFMTRTLDTFADARMNTIFVWAGHIFPYIVEMPDYPEAASDASAEQIKANQNHFRWFTTECEKRNIQVLLHFYNIHVSHTFANAHKIRTNPTTPTLLLREYTYYALSRYFEEFPSVGLYACPGESIHSKHQLEWFRDVIFKAAKDSDKNPDIVIRDWTLNHDFRDQLKSLYDNVYSELKQNDETLTSPYPDIRHMKWEGLTAGHIINAAHGPAEDLTPLRWANPLFVREMAKHWKSLGFVSGVEFWGQSFWHWPNTHDRVSPPLLYIDRDAPFYAVAGRYMWKTERAPEEERAYWNQYYRDRFASREVGELMARWYELSGSIGPGLINLNATRVANWWSSVVLMQQNVDQILDYNKSLDETPYTLHREAGRAHQRFYPRPFDNYFFERYKAKYNLPVAGKTLPMFKEFYSYKEHMQVKDLEQRKCMPVSQYAGYLEKGEKVEACLTPDKVIRLLNDLACEALELAEKAIKAAGESPHKVELQRFVTDSRIFKLATEALMAKEDAAILKACMLLKGEYAGEQADAFLKKMEESVQIYQTLHDLGQACYTRASFRVTWKNGLGEFKADLAKQRKWIARKTGAADWVTKFENTISGGFRIEAEWMEGEGWQPGTKYPGFEGSGYMSPPKPGETAPLLARIKLDAAQKLTVSVRALKGGAHQDRALAVDINGKRLKTTHQGEGPAQGEYTWEEAGVVTLPIGVTQIKVYPLGKRHPTADVIVLAPVREQSNEKPGKERL